MTVVSSTIATVFTLYSGLLPLVGECHLGGPDVGNVDVRFGIIAASKRQHLNHL